ncbi:hypothetical protein, partial [Streptomyces turgidiscabies]|uniref:hypothetical protein n=1 Tax=Streptomyces turgidiscabies TaxID=85558 RepID=UPI0038F5EF06
LTSRTATPSPETTNDQHQHPQTTLPLTPLPQNREIAATPRILAAPRPQKGTDCQAAEIASMADDP